jgi:transcriptional regulator with XRE-family HTH domain
MIEEGDIHVGQRIRMIRNLKGFSLRDLASKSDLSTNAISRIERGVNSPTVASLRRLANGLDVHVTDFFKERVDEETVFVKQGQGLRYNAVGAVIESLGTGIPGQNLEPFLFSVEPGHGSTSDTYTHPGEEFVHCVEGRIEYRVSNQIYVLNPGDSLLFKANQPHCFRNPLERPATLILVLQESEDEARKLARELHLDI